MRRSAPPAGACRPIGKMPEGWRERGALQPGSDERIHETTLSMNGQRWGSQGPSMKSLPILLVGSVALFVGIDAAGPPYPGNLRPPLNEVLDRTPAGELVPVSIILKDQVAPGRL